MFPVLLAILEYKKKLLQTLYNDINNRDLWQKVIEVLPIALPLTQL